MRIGFAYDSAYPWVNGGIEKRRFLIMQKLVEKGHEIHYFTMFRDGMPGNDFTYKGVRYHCAGHAPTERMYKKEGRRDIVWPLKFALLISFKFSGYKFDLIDTDAFPFLHIFPLYLHAKLSRTKFFVTWHEVWSLEYWKKYLGVLGYFGYLAEKLSSVCADKVIANVQTTKDDLNRLFGVSKEKIYVFAAAVSGDEIRQFKREHKYRKEDKFIVACRLIPEKRVDIALKAIAEVDAKLVIVGVGPERQRLEQLTESLKIRSKVEFMHDIKEQTLLEELSSSKALLMLSEREGLSLITLEALAIGTTVISISSAMLPIEVRKFCEVVDQKQLAGQMKEVLKRRQQNDLETSKLVLSEFSADNTDSFYRKMVE